MKKSYIFLTLTSFGCFMHASERDYTETNKPQFVYGRVPGPLVPGTKNWKRYRELERYDDDIPLRRAQEANRKWWDNMVSTIKHRNAQPTPDTGLSRVCKAMFSMLDAPIAKPQTNQSCNVQ